ncbi:MAG: hypothetical protein ACTSRA_08300 [Promethearchaeota archaeon]
MRDAYKGRPAIEAAQSSNNTFYNTGRMNTRGIDNVRRWRAMNYCLDLTRALTVTKLGRPSLISTLRAFTASRDEFLPVSAGDHTRKSGYDLLLPTIAELRREKARITKAGNQGRK